MLRRCLDARMADACRFGTSAIPLPKVDLHLSHAGSYANAMLPPTDDGAYGSDRGFRRLPEIIRVRLDEHGGFPFMCFTGLRCVIDKAMRFCGPSLRFPLQMSKVDAIKMTKMLGFQV